MTTEKQLWVGYYQLTYLNQPNTLYFGHLIGFAENRDIFQQRIEDYKTHYQCKLSSQLAPLPATTWFQRHGYQAAVWSAAQQLKEQELRFLLVQQETQQGTQSYLSQESLTISPLQSIFETHSYHPPYLPEALVNHPFFAQLNSRENPKEGLVYPNPDFIPNPDNYRYYTVVDGVKSFILPQLCEREGQTDSLYKGDLKNRMDTNAPYLTQLTVNDEGISGFTQILFTQAEQEWFGCWDINPAIFIRTKHSFEEVHYHLRKFLHLYKEETEKWYFFRFYDPQVLVAYLHHIEYDPTRLAAFFGFRNGECIIEYFAARIANRFYIFNLKELPPETQPSAVAFDNEMERFLEEYDKRQLLEKLQTEIIPAEFPEQKIAEADIDKYFNQTLELGFKIEGSITNVVKTLCYLSGDLTKLKRYWLELEKEYGNDLTEIELGELLCEKINLR